MVSRFIWVLASIGMVCPGVPLMWLVLLGPGCLSMPVAFRCFLMLHPCVRRTPGYCLRVCGVTFIAMMVLALGSMVGRLSFPGVGFDARLNQ